MNAQVGVQDQSSRYLRPVLMQFWIGSSLLIAAGLLLFNVVERQQALIRDADQLVTLVRSSLLTGLPPSKWQALLDTTLSALREQRLDSLNVALLLDGEGRITYSSRPTWRQLRIDDPLVDGAGTEDQDFQRVVRCFRERQGDCSSLRSQDSVAHPLSFSVVRPVDVPALRSLNRPGQRLLMIVNVDPGVVLVSLAGDLQFILPQAGLLAGLLCLLLGSTLKGELLPRLRDEAQTDGLTRLMNRTLFMELAKALLADAEQQSTDMVFVILDLDHFKRINDTYGHVCGDSALVQVAELLATVTPPEDLVCRFGGEEFALLLNGSRATGAKHLERLRLQLEMSRLNHQGHRIPLRASFGAAASSACGYNLDYLYTCADQALYAAKQLGRNRVGWNDGELQNRLAR